MLTHSRAQLPCEINRPIEVTDLSGVQARRILGRINASSELAAVIASHAFHVTDRWGR
ncbi:hypothetical protein [Methylobacterium oryzisoli]|uniref:hypothetical protein n=1 Tax=Methylobacterium oryzisoli TaxID=3385502 RepID=UPI0038922A7B